MAEEVKPKAEEHIKALAKIWRKRGEEEKRGD